MIRSALFLSACVLTLAACNQREEAARDVLNMQNDSQAVPVNGAMENFGTSTTGAGAVQSSPLRMADGREVGSVSMREESGATMVTVSVNGMPKGTYGMHIHAVGKCEGPKFESAGAHWNPLEKQHGKNNPQGPHAGDLDNLEVGEAGSGGATITLNDTSISGGLSPILDEDGAALMIHAKADDYRTDPSGNSGDRIACAVLGAGAPAR